MNQIAELLPVANIALDVDVAVVGVADAEFGQVLAAFVVRADGATTTGDELRGPPMVDSAAVWQERGMVWGGVLLLVGLLVVVGRWVRRERRWAGPDSSLRPILPGRV